MTQSSCEIDPKFIQEHIIESLDENEFRSLAGQIYSTVEHELHTDTGFVASVLSTDLFHLPTDQSRSFRRQMISNTLDKRFHQPIEVVSLDELEHPETSEEVRKRKQKAR